MHLSCLYRQARQTVGPISIGADTLADAIALGPKRGCGGMRSVYYTQYRCDMSDASLCILLDCIVRLDE